MLLPLRNKMAAMLLSVTFTASVTWLLLCPTLSTASIKKSDHVITVTEDNWQSLLKGEWMVEFMAPWCPACRSFQSVWQSLAEWSRDLEINVGVVDVTESPGLSGRFFVTSLPTIYHVKDGQFRVYKGPRREKDLLSFVDDKKWKEVEPVSSWQHPDSFFMGAAGVFFRLANSVRAFYSTLTTVYNIPEWGCFIIFAVGVIILGILLGLVLVVCWDWVLSLKYKRRGTVHKVYEEPGPVEGKDDESDLIDDSAQEIPSACAVASDSNTSVRKRQCQNKSDTESNQDEGEDKMTGDEKETSIEGSHRGEGEEEKIKDS